MRLVKYIATKSEKGDYRSYFRKEMAYHRLGVDSSFGQFIKYSNPFEFLKVLFFRKRIGRELSERISSVLKRENFDFEIEGRSKTIASALDKLTRLGRPGNILPESILKFLQFFNIHRCINPIGSIRDWYGIRIKFKNLTPDYPLLYSALDPLFDCCGIKSKLDLSLLNDRVIEPVFREYGIRRVYFRSLHFSFIYDGIPVEVQMRDAMMDALARSVAKRTDSDT